MKLIINISETDYNTYKHFGDKGSYTERIIANGVPYKQDERPKGKWMYNPDCVNNEMQSEFYCSECKRGAYPTLDNYCPHCGAEMSGGDV